MAPEVPPHCDTDGRRESGMTLLELLIGLSLLSLVMVVATNGLHFTTAVWQKVDARGAEHSEIRLAQALLRSQLASIVSGEIGLRRRSDSPVVMGFSDRLDFLSASPVRSIKPGLYRLGLRLEDSGLSKNLVLNWSLADPSRGADRAADSRNSRVILSNVRTLNFAYYGHIPGDGTTDWRNSWTTADAVPGLIRVTIAFEGRSTAIWPEFIVAVGG